MNREKQLEEYRKQDILELLEQRFNGSYEPSTIEQVIIEKTDKKIDLS